MHYFGTKTKYNENESDGFEKERRTHNDFYIYNTATEIVDYLKYLGITSYQNGNWFRTHKSIEQHASYAVYNLFTVLIILNCQYYKRVNFLIR